MKNENYIKQLSDLYTEVKITNILINKYFF